MRVYVSGRIKDYVEHEEHFTAGVRAVKEMGHEPVCPLDLDGKPDASYQEWMRIDLLALLECDGIYMLQGWERSVGARTEHTVAAVCGLEILYEEAT